MPAGSTNRPLFSLILLAALSLVPALASQPSKLIASVDGDYSQHRLSSDGRTLVYTVREGAAEVLWSVATDGTHPPQRLTPENVKEAARIRSFLISPNGKNVVFVSVSIRPPVAGEEALGHSFSGPSVVSGVGGEIYGEGLTFTSPVPSETTGQEHSEYLYSVPLDGSSAPVLLAEGKIKRTIIPAIPATASQPPGSDREYTTYPFSFQYIFSDDSQYLLYVQSEGVRTEVQISRGGFSGQVDFPVHRVFRVNLEHPQQRVDITPTLHPTIRSAVIYQIGFVPRGHDAYIMYKRNDPMLSLPLDSYNEQEIQIIYLNQPETPVLGFSAVHYYQQFVPDGKRLLLVEPDVLKAPQLYVYDLTTGLKTHLSTASTHTDGRLFLHSVELYGDWVLYYPKGRAYAVFNPNLANVPCFVTHLHYPQRDRKISDNCNQASLDLTKNRIYYSTFERMAGESTYGFSGPYYLMRQFLNEPGSVERLAEGHWESGFENANIFGASLTPDNHWITQSDRSTPDNTTPKTQWRNPDNSTDTVDWHHSGYFTTDGMRLVLPEQVTEPGPSVLAGRYDPLILPTFETTAGQYITQTPMPDNCRIFTYTRQKDSRYYMTDCDRPWSDLWWDPAYAGQGIRVQQTGDRIFLSWFTYDEQGQAMWLTLSGQLYEQQLQGTLMRYTGPALGTDWDQKQVKGIPAGQATFVLHDDQLSGTFDYQVNGIKGQLALQPFYPGPSNQLDGFWWQPKTSGQGVQIYHKGDYLFGVAYLYDKTGQATWVTFQGCLTGNLFEAALQRFTGPRLGNRWDATQVKAQAVGSIQLRLIGIIRFNPGGNRGEIPYWYRAESSVIELNYTINNNAGHMNLERFRF